MKSLNFFKNRSISFKLLLTFLLTAILLIPVILISSGGGFKKHLEDSMRPHLHQYLSYINEEIGNPPNPAAAKKLSESLKVRIILQGPDLNWSSDGKFLKRDRFRLRQHQNEKGFYESGKYRNRFVLRFKNEAYTTTFITRKDDRSPPIGRTLFALLCVLSLLYFLLRWMISPIKDIQKSVKIIGSGDLSHRIPIDRKDDFGELSTEVNAMANDVEQMLEAKRQLLLAISHELRSPVTRAKVAVSLMDDERLKNSLEDDLNEMEAMISGLLEAEKLNHRHQALNIEDTDLADVITKVIKQHFSKENISLQLDSNTSSLFLDDARMFFTVKNLISNALKHRKTDNDEIAVRLHHDKLNCIFTVEDTGKGVPIEHIEHLTEPFYRVDPSRDRNTGGYGLGLYIIDRIVDAHQGKLIIDSKENIGTTVTVKLPLAQNN